MIKRWRYWLMIPPSEPMPYLWWLAISEWLHYRDTEFGYLRLWVRRRRRWVCQPYGGTLWSIEQVRPGRELIRSRLPKRT